MARMTKTSKENLLVADRIEIYYNATSERYNILVYRGERFGYISDSSGVINYESITDARRVTKRIRPDLEPTTI